MATNIPSVPSDGNVAARIVPAIADLTAPTVTEVSAGVDVSCYLTSDGLAMTVDQATITDERLCSTETYGQPGRKTYGQTLTGIDNTNSAHATTDNLLVDTLVEGTEMFLVRRRGVPFDQAFAADDKVTIVPFKPGVKTDVAPEANSVTRSTWTCFITGNVAVEVAVVAS